MRKAPLLGLLLAVLAAPSFGAVFGHAWFDMNISELPASCDPGRVFMVKDGDSASDCSTGTGSDIHGCVCDSGGASYTALSAVAVAGGSDTEFQYNNGGSVIDGATGATYNDTSGLVTLQHQTDAASVEQLQIRGPDRATPAIGDEDAGGFEEQARITAALDVVTDAAEESSIRFDIQKAGTLTEAFIMGYDDTDGGRRHGWRNPPVGHLDLRWTLVAVGMGQRGSGNRHQSIRQC
jgi:hypothetical protein